MIILFTYVFTCGVFAMLQSPLSFCQFYITFPTAFLTTALLSTVPYYRSVCHSKNISLFLSLLTKTFPRKDASKQYTWLGGTFEVTAAEQNCSGPTDS